MYPNLDFPTIQSSSFLISLLFIWTASVNGLGVPLSTVPEISPPWSALSSRASQKGVKAAEKPKSYPCILEIGLQKEEMDKANSCCLNRLPAELIGLMLSNEPYSHLVLPLWICGNAFLNAKIAAEVRYVDLKADWSLNSNFPTILFNLRKLRFLSLDSSGELVNDPSNWPSILRSLPSSLETLKLSAPEADLSILNYAPDWSLDEPRFIKTAYPRGESAFIDLATIFPQLKSLSVGPAKFESSDLAGLPSTLTYLKIQPNSCSNLMRLLPPSLIHFKANLDAVLLDEVRWPEAPPNLQTVGRISFIRNDRPLDYSWMPRSLRKFLLNEAVAATAETLATLPPCIETLYLTCNNVDFWPLPSTLTTLEVTLTKFDLNFILLLPRTLTLINTQSATIVDWEGITAAQQLQTAESASLWPPKLKTLISSYSIPSLTIDHLPDSLTDLSISMTNFTMGKRSGGTYDLKVLAKFPSNLASLKIVVLGPTPVTFDSGPLPQSLKYLEILPSTGGCPTFSDDTALTLSLHRGLQTLSIHDLTYDAVLLLPRNLTDLSAVDALGLGSPIDDGPSTTNFMEHLPASLTNLQLTRREVGSGPRPVLLSVNSFAHLTHLHSIRLPEYIALPSSGIRHISRTVRLLCVSIQSIEEVDAPFLPPCLEHTNTANIRVDWKLPYIGLNWPLACTENLPEPAFTAVLQRRQEANI